MADLQAMTPPPAPPAPGAGPPVVSPAGRRAASAVRAPLRAGVYGWSTVAGGRAARIRPARCRRTPARLWPPPAGPGQPGDPGPPWPRVRRARQRPPRGRRMSGTRRDPRAQACHTWYTERNQRTWVLPVVDPAIPGVRDAQGARTADRAEDPQGQNLTGSMVRAGRRRPLPQVQAGGRHAVAS